MNRVVPVTTLPVVMLAAGIWSLAIFYRALLCAFEERATIKKGTGMHSAPHGSHATGHLNHALLGLPVEAAMLSPSTCLLSTALILLFFPLPFLRSWVWVWATMAFSSP